MAVIGERPHALEESGERTLLAHENDGEAIQSVRRGPFYPLYSGSGPVSTI